MSVITRNERGIFWLFRPFNLYCPTFATATLPIFSSIYPDDAHNPDMSHILSLSYIFRKSLLGNRLIRSCYLVESHNFFPAKKSKMLCSKVIQFSQFFVLVSVRPSLTGISWSSFWLRSFGSSMPTSNERVIRRTRNHRTEVPNLFSHAKIDSIQWNKKTCIFFALLYEMRNIQETFANDDPPLNMKNEESFGTYVWNNSCKNLSI